MSVVLAFARPIVVWAFNSPQVKSLVVELLEKYAKTTDNSIDDAIVAAVKAAIFKDQITGQVSELANKYLN